MTRRISGLVALAASLPVAFACGSAPPSVAATRHEEPFAAFWPRFRAAALAGDAGALTQMAAANVRLPGPIDGAAAGAISRDLVPATVLTALAQDSGINPDRVVTVRQFVEATPAITGTITGTFAPNIAVAGDGAQVGAFEFRRIDGRWLLTAIYLRADVE